MAVSTQMTEFEVAEGCEGSGGGAIDASACWEVGRLAHYTPRIADTVREILGQVGRVFKAMTKLCRDAMIDVGWLQIRLVMVGLIGKAFRILVQDRFLYYDRWRL